MSLKLLQSPWSEVRKEIIEEKRLDEIAADKIGEYVRNSGSIELIDTLLNDSKLKNIPSAVKGLEAMRLLLNYCDVMGLKEKILFDVSLARGLDYYTGVIYEAVLKGLLLHLLLVLI